MIAFTAYYMAKKPHPASIFEGLSTNTFLSNISIPKKSILSKKKNAEIFYYSYIDGDNLVHTPSNSYMAENNIDLVKNDELFTGAGSLATLTFINDSKITLRNGTKLKIKQLPRKDKSGLYIFELKRGRIMMDFSDESSKYAVKFVIGEVQVYTRRSTLFASIENGRVKIAVDYGTAKVNLNEESTFLIEGQGIIVAGNSIEEKSNHNWVEGLAWDEYFHDLNRTGRSGPFSMKKELLSKRFEKRTRKKKTKRSNVARAKTKNNSNRKLSSKETSSKLDEAIKKSGGGLLEKIPVYGNKIKDIKDQINLNTEAMQERDKMLEDIEE
jgi:hypothetical protein